MNPEVQVGKVIQSQAPQLNWACSTTGITTYSRGYYYRFKNAEPTAIITEDTLIILELPL